MPVHNTVCRGAFSRPRARLLRALRQVWTRTRFAYRYGLWSKQGVGNNPHPVAELLIVLDKNA